MRMEELADGKYIKSTDHVEKYLLNIIQEYFKHNNIAENTSREYIIKKAVTRMKEEMDFEQLGVLSIILPDGTTRIGAVHVSLEELGGEPIIQTKKSAFNVDFGTTKGTACEGNDSRLSDPRLPLEHKHKIEDINNLQSFLSTIQGKLDRQDNHQHENKELLDKITYSGTQSLVDLAEYETEDDKIQNLINELNQDINAYRQAIQTQITEVLNQIDDIEQELNTVRQTATNNTQDTKDEVTQYANTAVANTEQAIQAKLNDLVTKPVLENAMSVVSNSYIHFGKATVNIKDILLLGDTEYTLIPTDILDKIHAIYTVPRAEDVIIQTSIVLDNKTYPIPYIIVNDNIVLGSVYTSITDLCATINITCNSSNVPQFLHNATIVVNYYIRQEVSV